MPVNNIDLSFTKGQRPKINVEPSHAFDVFLNQKYSGYDIFLEETSYEKLTLIKEKKPSFVQKCAAFFKQHKKEILIGLGLTVAGILLFRNRKNIKDFFSKKPDIKSEDIPLEPDEIELPPKPPKNPPKPKNPKPHSSKPTSSKPTDSKPKTPPKSKNKEIAITPDSVETVPTKPDDSVSAAISDLDTEKQQKQGEMKKLVDLLKARIEQLKSKAQQIDLTKNEPESVVEIPKVKPQQAEEFTITGLKIPEIVEEGYPAQNIDELPRLSQFIEADSKPELAESFTINGLKVQSEPQIKGLLPEHTEDIKTPSIKVKGLLPEHTEDIEALPRLSQFIEDKPQTVLRPITQEEPTIKGLLPQGTTEDIELPRLSQFVEEKPQTTLRPITQKEPAIKGLLPEHTKSIKIPNTNVKGLLPEHTEDVGVVPGLSKFIEADSKPELAESFTINGLKVQSEPQIKGLLPQGTTEDIGLPRLSQYSKPKIKTALTLPQAKPEAKIKGLLPEHTKSIKIPNTNVKGLLPEHTEDVKVMPRLSQFIEDKPQTVLRPIIQEEATIKGLLPQGATEDIELPRLSQFIEEKPQTVLRPIVHDEAEVKELSTEAKSVTQKAAAKVKPLPKKTGYFKCGTKCELIRKPNGLFYTDDGTLASGSYSKVLKDGSKSIIAFQNGRIVKSQKFTKVGRKKEFSFIKTYSRSHYAGYGVTGSGKPIVTARDELEILTQASPNSQMGRKHVIKQFNVSGKTVKRTDSFLDVYFPNKFNQATVEHEAKRIEATPVTRTTYDATRGYDNFSLLREDRTTKEVYGFDVLPGMGEKKPIVETEEPVIDPKSGIGGISHVTKKTFLIDTAEKFTEELLEIVSNIKNTGAKHSLDKIPEIKEKTYYRSRRARKPYAHVRKKSSLISKWQSFLQKNS